MESPLLDKSPEFASRVVLFYEDFSKSRKNTTIAKLHISLKETSKSIYWLSLLKRTIVFEYTYDLLLSQAEGIKRMLIASINTAKGNNRG